MVINGLALCSGVDCLGLALKLAIGDAFRTVCHVEIEAYACAVLAARMQDGSLDQAPIWDNIHTFDSRAWRGKISIVYAGFPCQPFSVAGKRKGKADDRWLWGRIAEIIRDVDASLVFLENVPGLVAHGLPDMLVDLAALGFDAEWTCLTAAEVGASHKRDRFFLLAHRADDQRRRRECGAEEGTGSRSGGRGRLAGRNGAMANSECPAPHEQATSRGGPEGGAPTEPGDAMANAGDGLLPRKGRGPEGRGGVGSRSETLADSDSRRRTSCEHTGSAGETVGRRQGYAIEGDRQLADPTSAGPQERGDVGRDRGEELTPALGTGLPCFAPGPGSSEWPGILAAHPWLAPALEPGFRVLVDESPVVVDEARTDQLRCAGNGVVVAQAATAFVGLAGRMKIELAARSAREGE